jgi:hypothetical protein
MNCHTFATQYYQLYAQREGIREEILEQLTRLNQLLIREALKTAKIAELKTLADSSGCEGVCSSREEPAK